MANVKNALEFVEAFFFVVEIGALPAEGVSGGGFEVAFFGHVVLLWDFYGVFLKTLRPEP
jgi:hypothetical protein